MVARLADAPLTGASAPRTVITSLAQLDAEIDSWYGQDFALDLETSGLDYTRDQIVGIAITLADERSYYIVLKHTVPHEHPDLGLVDYPLRTYCPPAETFRRMAWFFAQDDVTFIAHNLKFELHFLSRAGVTIGCYLADTMLAAHLIDENRRVGLKYLAPLVGIEMTPYQLLSHYPGFEKDSILGVPLNAVAAYAMDDSFATWKLWRRFLLEMEDEGVEEAFTNIWMPCLITLQQMEAKGIALDMGKVASARKAYEQRADAADAAIWRDGISMVLDRLSVLPEWTELPTAHLKPLVDVEQGGEVDGDTFRYRGVTLPILRKERKSFRPRIPWFNPGSTDQLRQLLFDRHGLRVPDDISFTLNKNGDVGVDKDTLKVLAYELGDEAPPVLSQILEYRKASKILSTYIRTYEERSDPLDAYCLRTSFNQTSTDTGRLSSSAPNLQNQPSRGDEGKIIRDLFIARPGYKLVVADYSMMELRMAAHFSGDPAMTRAFTEGLDLHSLTAADQSRMSYEDFVEAYESGDPKAKLARQVGKTSNFGLLYGMGAKKFQRYLLVEVGVKVTLAETQALIDSFNSTYAGISDWKRTVSSFVKKNGYIWTIGKRKRRLPEVWSADDYEVSTAHRQAVNARIQGSCADIINGIIPTAQQVLRELGGYLLLQVHDELVAEVPQQWAEQGAHALERVMTLPNDTYRLRVPLIAEAGIGDSWWSAK